MTRDTKPEPELSVDGVVRAEATMAISLSLLVQAEKKILFMWLDTNRTICRNESLATGGFARRDLQESNLPCPP